MSGPFITAPQADVIRMLRAHFGREDTCVISGPTGEPYGIVRLRWGIAPMVGRERYIHPDGSRLQWREAVPVPE